MIYVHDRVENIADDQHFLLFPQSFQKVVKSWDCVVKS